VVAHELHPAPAVGRPDAFDQIQHTGRVGPGVDEVADLDDRCDRGRQDEGLCVGADTNQGSEQLVGVTADVADDNHSGRHAAQ